MARAHVVNLRRLSERLSGAMRAAEGAGYRVQGAGHGSERLSADGVATTYPAPTMRALTPTNESVSSLAAWSLHLQRPVRIIALTLALALTLTLPSP